MGDSPRILIIDDDENIRKMLTAVLEEEGYTVESVGTGKKAIEKTKKSVYNLALIDIRLPDIDGTKLLTKVRDTTPKMRKIIITGYPTLQNAIEAVNKGADAYIMKPFAMSKVLKVIKNQLARQAKEKNYSQEKVTEFIEARVKEFSIKKMESRKP
jgi:DNA-binding NtrC family response regulator